MLFILKSEKIVTDNYKHKSKNFKTVEATHAGWNPALRIKQELNLDWNKRLPENSGRRLFCISELS